MGDFYRGTGYLQTHLGSCENGSIYRGSGLYRSQIGSYEGGCIYRGGRLYGEQVGRYENGSIYRGSGFDGEYIGRYEQGTVYVPSGLSDCAVGSYDGDGAEAAAYLLFMHDELPSYAVDESSEPQDSSSEYSAAVAYVAGSAGRAGGTGRTIGVSNLLFRVFGWLLLAFCSVLIWWATFQATGVAELPYLIVLAASIMLGLFVSVVFLKADCFRSIYLTTIVIASVINIIASFFTSPGYSIFLIVLIPPIVVALTSAIPAALTSVAVSLIRRGSNKQRAKNEEA